MKIQYIFNEDEVRAAKERLKTLRNIALMSRDAGEIDDNREFYLRAKGFEDCLVTLGLIKAR